MKVILFQNVENLGLPGEIAEVKAGYFRNFLCPRGIAAAATPSNLKSLEQKRKKLQAEAAKITKDAESLGQQLKEVRLTFRLKAGENDRLFGSVTTGDVADQLMGLGFDIDRRRISIPTAIKTTGNFSARVRLQANVSVPIAVIVEREGGPVPEEAPAKAEPAAENAHDESSAE